jgi:hypothetical protein
MRGAHGRAKPPTSFPEKERHKKEMTRVPQSSARTDLQ